MVTQHKMVNLKLQKQIDLETTFLNAVKAGPKLFHELELVMKGEKCQNPKMTVWRYKTRFKELGLIVEDKDGRIHWFENVVKPVSSVDIGHIKDFEEGTDMLLEDFNVLIYSPPIIRRDKYHYITVDGIGPRAAVSQTLKRLRHTPENTSKIALAKAHLESGYPGIYKTYKKLLEIEARPVQYPNRNEFTKHIKEGKPLSVYGSGTAWWTANLSDIRDLYPDFFKVHQELAGQLGMLKASFKYDHPLLGKCEVCHPPEVKRSNGEEGGI